MSDALVSEAVRKSITVDCPVEEAFRVFTADAMSWWPVPTHSIHESNVREIVFDGREGGEIYEVSASGETGHWATVLTWEPPRRLVLAWNVMRSDPVPTEVEIRFSPDGDGTRIELEHRGWEALGETGVPKRASYDTGWDYVLGFYVRRIG